MACSRAIEIQAILMAPTMGTTPQASDFEFKRIELIFD
jgi:hypothetical protein